MSRNTIQIGWTNETLAQHLADQARARRRIDQERRRSSVATRYSEKAKARDNRARGKREFRKEVWA